MISGTVSTRKTSTQTLDTRLLCGPSFSFLCAKGESECSGSLLHDPQEMVGQCGRSRDTTSHSLRAGGDLRGASPCDSAESPVRKKCTHCRTQLNNRTRALHHHKRVSQVTHAQCTAQVTVARETRMFGAASFQLCPPPPRPPSLRALLSV